VLGKLVETENTLDAAYAQSAELLSEVLQARKDVNAPLTVADPVQAKLMEAIKALSEARTAMVGVHTELTEAKLRLGIRTSLGGIDSQMSPHLLVETNQVSMRDVG
jgi:hypothetical protein